MSGYLVKTLLAPLIMAGLLSQASAQTTPTAAPDRGASFLPQGSLRTEDSSKSFSGFAAAPQESPTASTPETITAVPLPNVSPESVGMNTATGIGVEAWKGTPRPVAEKLLSITTPSYSPELNRLVKRLLATSAAPPEGETASEQYLTSARIQKLAEFGSNEEAWALASNADPKLVSDAAMLAAAANALISKSADAMCGKAFDISKTRTQADWQKTLITCLLRAKNAKAAQVALDVFRMQSNRDVAFIEIADKLQLEGDKSIPFRITPLTPEALALLKMYDAPLPGELYNRPDAPLVSALLASLSKRDVARLSLAERALSQGLASGEEIAAVYRSVKFPPAATASPLNSGESGIKLRALLFTAAEKEQTPATRLDLAARFMQSSAPALLNASGSLLAIMLQDIKPEASIYDKAAIAAQAYMLAGKNDLALEWLKCAKQNGAADAITNLWPQFALAGFVSDADYATEFNSWLDSATKTADPIALRDIAGATMLLMDAAGLKVPEAAWAKVLAPPHNEKRVALSPIIYDRLMAASTAGRRAETVLLASALAGEKTASIPSSTSIARALRQAGLKNEAATFARHAVALLTKESR